MGTSVEHGGLPGTAALVCAIIRLTAETNSVISRVPGLYLPCVLASRGSAREIRDLRPWVCSQRRLMLVYGGNRMLAIPLVRLAVAPAEVA